MAKMFRIQLSLKKVFGDLLSICRVAFIYFLFYIQKIKVKYFFPFAFNAKSFSIAILAFFNFFLLVTFFWTDCQKLFSQRFNINYQESVWPRSESFLGHIKKYSQKNCSSNCYSRPVWHVTHDMNGNQHSQHPKKLKKQPENRKQVS